MTRQTKLFAIQIAQDADEAPAWPPPSGADDPEFEGNLKYSDIRTLSAAEARRAIDRDRAYIAQWVEESAPPERGTDESEDDDDFDDDVETILQRAVDALDVGVAGTVAALAAVGCVPYTSCNGGAFGGRHSDHIPSVWFFAPPRLIVDLISCARETSVGFVIESNGRIEVFAGKIEHMVTFAEAVLTRLVPTAAVRART